ncbi:MAG: hypothetical protein Q9225_000068 [Loekoesia sp. 1 TL-2023]
MAPQPSEADIIFNRANVTLARSKRLVASWLPPRTEDEMKNAKTEEEIEKEEQELFTPMPELLGLGAKPPEDIKDGDLKRQKLSSNDVLRKQLLGKDYARAQDKESRRQGIHGGLGGILSAGSKSRPTPTKRKAEDESSGDEGGRSSLGKRKYRDMGTSNGSEGTKLDASNNHVEPNEHARAGKNARKATNYLDEVLSQKEKKHKKKKKKKGAEEDGRPPMD